MKYIIQIGTLYDNYNDMDFGYIGKDLKTGEIHYYAMYDNQGNYSSHCVTEFDINQENNWENLDWHLYHCNYKKDKKTTSNELPGEILSLIPEMINIHLIYNKENGYPIEFLTNNSTSLSIEYVNNFSLFGDLGFSGRYIPVQNVIEIPITNNEWDNYSDYEKKDAKDVLLHETGHLKVSSHKLDMINKQLNVRTGFFSQVIKVEPIVLDNGDIFFRSNKINALNDDNSRILEEVMNDFECMQINPDFNPVYPNVGYMLNELCDGRLQMARYYDDGIEELYESLSKIIKSRDMVDKLLESIECTSKSYDFNYEENNSHMMKLLKQYQIIKSCK